jgi:ABC-type amino acid transport substrate-binding protein
MEETGRRRTALQRAWQNLILRSAAYYALLIAAAVGLWRWLPDTARLLTGDLAGELGVGGTATGAAALGEALSQPAVGPRWSSDMVSAGVAMTAAGLLALPLAWLYTLVRQKKGYRQSLVHSLIMLPVVVAGVVVLVKNSLALAFSLAGIVAAVRFRNTLEDSKDAVYIFVATGIGLAAGVDLPVAAALSIVFNVVAVALWYSDLGRSSASLEGGIAERRLRQALAHVNRTSGFVQRLDDEVLEAMSAEQLDALASRARRRRQRQAPDDRYGSILRIRANDIEAAMAAAEPVLSRFLKRWKFNGAVPDGDGTQVVEYAIQLKKNTDPAELAEALQRGGGACIVGVEVC